jgi:hypothetical protein
MINNPILNKFKVRENPIALPYKAIGLMLRFKPNLNLVRRFPIPLTACHRENSQFNIISLAIVYYPLLDALPFAGYPVNGSFWVDGLPR